MTEDTKCEKCGDLGVVLGDGQEEPCPVCGVAVTFGQGHAETLARLMINADDPCFGEVYPWPDDEDVPWAHKAKEQAIAVAHLSLQSLCDSNLVFDLDCVKSKLQVAKGTLQGVKFLLEEALKRAEEKNTRIYMEDVDVQDVLDSIQSAIKTLEEDKS